ncbi:MAG: UPF0146 family protein [Natronomonas sp.]
MTRNRSAGLVDALAHYDRVVEVGIGERVDVAAALAARGATVIATDVYERDVPESVEFVIDDVTEPDERVYEGADAVYARNCPPELQRPLVDIAEAVGADALFTTLGADPVVVEATPQARDGETLFRAHTRDTSE